MKCTPGALVALFAALSGTAAQAVTYQFIDIRPAGATTVQVWDVNNLGQVVGTYGIGDAPQQAFVWQGGTISPLAGPAGAIGVAAFSISETGVAVGSYYDTQVVDPGTGELRPGPTSGWVLAAGVYSTVTVPGADFVQLRGISPDGRYVAGYYTGPSLGQVGFVLDRSTGSRVSTNGPSSAFNIAQGINAAYQVAGGDTVPGVGSPGYVYDVANDTRSDVLLPGAVSTRLRDLDNGGRFAGWAVFPGAPGSPAVTRGVLGTAASFETLMFPGSSYTALQGINDAGWLSGSYQLVTPSPGFWGFVAIPIPEPATWALWLAGAGGLLVWTRRARRPSA
jgi:probable HAF family extracellular repeat protein